MGKSAFDDFMANNSNPSLRAAFDAGAFASRKQIEKFRGFDDEALKKASYEEGVKAGRREAAKQKKPAAKKPAAKKPAAKKKKSICRGRVSAEMMDSELKVGLAFHGISCVAAFAILLYKRRKAEQA